MKVELAPVPRPLPVKAANLAPICSTQANPARIKRPITAPRLWWKGAAKAVTKPKRLVLRGKRKRKSGEAGALLPWRIPKPLSADEQMWADYRAFKAADMLHAWLDLYRHVLNLKPSFMEAIP